MNITINNKEYKIKYTIRAIFLYEAITKKPFEINTLTDSYVFFYSMLLANNPDNVIEWDEFIDALDSDPKLFEQLNAILTQQQNLDKMYNEDEVGDGEKKS